VRARVAMWFAIIATLLFTACGGGSSRVAMAPSSMTTLTDEIDDALSSDTEWVIAGSARLVGQLADGASADVLITADRETMQSAIDQSLVADEPIVIAGNRLVLAIAPGNPGEVERLEDLTSADLLLGVCASEVPCGRLAAEAQATLGIDIAADTEEPNVRSLALKITNGELDAGLIYATDAADLGLATIDDSRLEGFVTEYLAASVRGEPSDITMFLTSDPGRRLLADRGFTLP